MQRISGYVWEITSSADKKYRVLSEEPNVEEGLQEFRRIHGYQVDVLNIKYFAKYGDIDGWS